MMMDCYYHHSSSSSFSSSSSPSPLLLFDSSVSLASAEFADVIGQLALLGSVGFGMAYSKTIDPDWHYEYKVGNDYACSNSDVGLLEVTPVSVLERVSFGGRYIFVCSFRFHHRSCITCIIIIIRHILFPRRDRTPTPLPLPFPNREI